MGVLKHLQEDSLISSDEKCHICGENQATGYWSGAQGMFCVCAECAKDFLPILIADALEHIDNIDYTGRNFKHIEMVFWKAAYIRAVFSGKKEWCSHTTGKTSTRS